MRYVFPSRETAPLFNRLRPTIWILGQLRASAASPARRRLRPVRPAWTWKTKSSVALSSPSRGPFINWLGEVDGRGEFDDAGLAAIVRLARADGAGLKVRFGHPDLTHPGKREDELSSFLGRAKNARVDGDRVRADLHFDPVAFLPIQGGVSRGDYLLARAKSDPASFGASPALSADKEFRMDNHRKPRRDGDGDTLPPLWRPITLGSVDIVDRGAAAPGGFLAAGISDEQLRRRWANAKRKAGIK